jgi:type II secretory pathway pseudopilin PulG
MRTTANRRPHPDGGYALVLVMVSMMILGVLAMAALQRAAMDATMAGVAVRAATAEAGAHMGLEHARLLMRRGIVDPVAEAMEVAAAPGRCLNGWIGRDGNQVATPLSFPDVQSDYTVDLCYAACSAPSPGNDLAAGSNGGGFLVGISLDVVSNGRRLENPERVTTGGILHVDSKSSAPCL